MSEEDALVIVVDDDDEGRLSLTRLLQSADLRVETYDSTEAFLRSPRRDVPACLVLDVWLPGLNGLELQQTLTAAKRPIPIIFITGHDEIPLAVQAMHAGAVEFLPKPFPAQALLAAIQEALARDRAARRQHADVTTLRERYARLTPREREVMAHVVAGWLNKQIAAALGVIEQTVKMHRLQIMHKMQAVSLADLVKMADTLAILPIT